jgi:hypothetical protein
VNLIDDATCDVIASREPARPGPATCWSAMRFWRQVPAQPTVLALIESMLGNQCLISPLASIPLAPGETAQMIDAGDQIMPSAKLHVATVANSMWALTDFT